MKLGFVTCDALARYYPSRTNSLFTHDDQVAVQYLLERGYKVEPVLWGQSPQLLEQQGFVALVMRSPWNYSYTDESRRQFCEWIAKVHDSSLTLINDPLLMLWNLDKHYLAHLHRVSVPILPTAFIEPDDKVDFISHLQTHGPFVLKPAIGAGGRDLQRYLTVADIEEEPLSRLRHNRTFLMQPYVAEISSLGEWSLVYFGGQFSHAVLKRPGAESWLVQDELGGSVHSLQPNEEAIATANRAMASLPEAFFMATKQPFVPPVYARIDLIPFAGSYAVSEFELVEPELFFLARGHGQPTLQLEVLERFHRSLSAALTRA